MNKVLLIGNSGKRNNSNDGQTVKTRIYREKMIEEGIDVSFIELDGFLKRPFYVLNCIKNKIKECDRIVLMSAERGSRFLIPYINFINRKLKKPFVLPLIGIGVLHSVVDRLSDSDRKNFFTNYKFYKKNNGFSKQLSKIDYILPETELISHIYKDYFHLNNVITLNNFRDCKIASGLSHKPSKIMNITYISRVWREKGIFDLLDVVQTINSVDTKIKLDIYGPNSLNREDNYLFNSLIESINGVSYLGVIKENEVVSVLSNYDLLVFPTRYFGEGTPGIISESFIAGTPILSSDFTQAKCLLQDGYDSILFNMLDKDDLMHKLLYLIENSNKLERMRKNALQSGRKYSYEFNRKVFLKYVCGIEK